MDCIFCKVAQKEIESKLLYEDDKVVAFNDLHPKAPYHVLIVPHEHIPTLNDVDDEHADLITHMIKIAKQIAKDLGIADSGYRILMNCNSEGGQEIYHIHLHLLGGHQLKWQPG